MIGPVHPSTGALSPLGLDVESDAVRTDRAVAVDVPAAQLPVSANGWPYGSPGDGRPEASTLTLVPYHLWANRGPATMRVWLPQRRG